VTAVLDSKVDIEAEKGDSPSSSLSSFMNTQSEHVASVNKSSRTRIAHPLHSEHGPSTNKSSVSCITKPWLPAGLIATSRTVKEAGDLHRLRDYSQGRNTQTSDYEITEYPAFMGKNHHPIKDMVIHFPSQPSEDKSRAPPRGVQRQSSFETHSEHESSASKAGSARAVNQWHSEHGLPVKRSSLARIVHSKSKTFYEAKDLNMDTYEPFLKAIRIPSEFSGDRSIKMQQMQMKESIEGNRQRKSQRRASSTFDGSPPIPPKRRPPSRASKSLDEKVFMSQLGRQRVPNRVKKENVRPPIPQEGPTPLKRVPTPPKRVSPKVPLNIIHTRLGRIQEKSRPGMKPISSKEVRAR
jgi:hypothetical protein